MIGNLTVGMAVYDDFDGVYFTCQSLRIHNKINPKNIVVINNNPKSHIGQTIGNYCRSVGIKHVELDSVRGTSAPRNLVFEVAETPWVMCIDSHVLLPTLSVVELAGWLEKERNYNSRDLYSGPILYDNLDHAETHFSNVWRYQMHGTWGAAWYKINFPDFPIFEIGEDAEGNCVFYSVDMERRDISKEHKFPANLKRAGAEELLRRLGFGPVAFSNLAQIEIPAMGLGLFMCRKDSWLKFNPHFTEFGGEEIYIHEKFRQAGRKNYCLPWLKWGHRTAYKEPTYPHTTYGKVRNYVLGHLELGWELSPIYDHFVEQGYRENTLAEHLYKVHAIPYEFSKTQSPEKLVELHARFKLSEIQWEHLIKHPVINKEPLQVTEQPATETARSIAQIYDSVRKFPRDLDKHFPKMLELANQCETVVEFSKRKESFVVWCASNTGKVVSHNTEFEEKIYKETLSAAYGNNIKVLSAYNGTSKDVEKISDCDLLFLDSEHTYSGLMRELKTFSPQVSKYIVIHDTEYYGDRGEDAGIGLKQTINEFLQEFPEWFISYHARQQYGLTVLCREESKRPEKPIRISASGPGTELAKLLKSVGIDAPPGCDCSTRMRLMDDWGADECEKKLDEIVGWMEEGQSRWGWVERIAAKAKAATLAIATGLAFSLDPLHPMRSMIVEAIRRSRA